VDLPNSNTFCSLCEIESESRDHLLFTHPISFSIWRKCHAWLGVQSILHHEDPGCFMQQTGIFSSKKVGRICTTI